ncbi:hypothetical protein [Micromonospora sp. LOL_021]|uniref:hypothetical protein n=1 Tax=Micromonospora sp. LOL_021 TaxID=3345417 RepID=UPI003A87501B
MPGSLPFRRLFDLFRRLLDRLPRRTTAGIIAGLAALSTVVATIGFGAASARDDDLIGQPVSDEQLAVIVAAAESCPMLNPARVAGQLMAESGLDADADTTTSGGQGIAGLDAQDWQDWAPWPAGCPIRRSPTSARPAATRRTTASCRSSAGPATSRPTRTASRRRSPPSASS